MRACFVAFVLLLVLCNGTHVLFAQAAGVPRPTTTNFNNNATPGTSSNSCSGAGTKAPPQDIHPGPLTLHVTRYDACESNLVATASSLFAGVLHISGVGTKTQQVEIESPTDMAGILSAIQSQTTDIVPELVPQQSGTKLAIRTTAPVTDPRQALSVTVEPEGISSSKNQAQCNCPEQLPLLFQRTTPNYLVILDAASRSKLQKHQVPVYVLAGDGRIYDLMRLPGADTFPAQDQGWYLAGDAKPLATLVIGNQGDPICSAEQAKSDLIRSLPR